MTSKTVPFLYFLKKGEEGKDMLKQIEKINVNSGNRPLDCQCGGNFKALRLPKTFHYEVAGNPKELVINNTPYYECEDCKEISENLLLHVEIEDAVKTEIFLRLNNRQEIPNEINFDDFVI